MNKNLWLLILSQVFAFTAAPVTVFLSGIIGSQFSPVKSLATLTDGRINYRYSNLCNLCSKSYEYNWSKGRFYVCIRLVVHLSSLLAAYSIIIESFILFNLACFLLGAGVAFSHQYRFAAVETVKKDMAPKAISIILLAGIGSAFIGPNAANLSKEIISGHLYAGSYIVLAALTLTSTIFLLFYKDGHKPNNINKENFTKLFRVNLLNQGSYKH